MGGGMEAHKNKFIEDWGSARENLEHNFRWTRRNFALVGVFGIALPLLVYKGIIREFYSFFIGHIEVLPPENKFDGHFVVFTCKMRMQGGHTGSSSEHAATISINNGRNEPRVPSGP